MKRRYLVSDLASWLVISTLLVLPAQAESARVGNADETTTEELRSLMTTALSAARQKDQAKLAEIARNLMIPDYELWLKAIFGDEEGMKLAAAYGMRAGETEKSYPKLFEWVAQQEGELMIEDARTLPKQTESWCGQMLVSAQKGDAVFYRVSVGKADSSGLRSGRVAGYFTLVGGAYRRLDCQLLGMRPPGSATMSGPLRVGNNVQAARILRRVAPEYPIDARMAHISGTVRLHAIIGKDGRIKRLEVISGPLALTEAALDAVRQWRYQPTMLNGDPVEVDTTIDVIFQLNR